MGTVHILLAVLTVDTFIIPSSIFIFRIHPFTDTKSIKMASRGSFPLALLVLCISVACILAQGVPTKNELSKVFNDRAQVEKMIQCFVGKRTCTAEEEAIKKRAQAMMRNFGHCPDHLCTPEERKNMAHAMELLQSKHSDLFGRLVLAMFGIDFGKR